MWKSKTKHCLHCCCFFVVILVVEILTGGIRLFDSHPSVPSVEIDPWIEYGYIGALMLYALRFLMLLLLPQVLFNFVGLTCYNAFPEAVVLKTTPFLSPFICIRVVTRGDFPQLVKTNLNRNMNKCLDAGLENLLIEVVTDKPIGLDKHRRVREVVVPADYRTKTGALYKARALQYCLEDKVNILEPDNWIVHLDEETLLTENAVKGILNFVEEGRYEFGQGLITYANEKIINWFTTIADSFRVADDMGKLRCQFRMFHKPLISWKGSFVVTKMSAEREVSFDHGVDGSIAEDCFFAMTAFSKGYNFNFIEGEMWEKSPFTLCDFIRQRKRWMQGILLVVHSKDIPIKYKILLACSCYSWITMPLSISNIGLAFMLPIPCSALMDFFCAFAGAVNIYMFMFGIIKSFSMHRFGFGRFVLCSCALVLVIPLNIFIENIAIVWGLLEKKHKFYVVDKNYNCRIFDA